MFLGGFFIITIIRITRIIIRIIRILIMKRRRRRRIHDNKHTNINWERVDQRRWLAF